MFVDGAVYTVNAAHSWASALAATGDRITYVGTDAGARALVGPHTRLIDLKQRMLLPGFANRFRDNRHTLAHLGLIADADVARFRTLGVVANMTPLWSMDDPWETIFAPRLFGPGRYSELHRTRILLEAGMVLVWGSDWSVTGVSPLDGLETALTRRYPGGKDPKGRAARWQRARPPISCSSGRNLFDTPPLEIHVVPVDMTVVAGEIIYERRTRRAASGRTTFVALPHRLHTARAEASVHLTMTSAVVRADGASS